MKTIVSLSKGNPGALDFLMKLCCNPDIPFRTVAQIENSGIEGTDLYVLYADIANRDMQNVIKLMDNCPLDVLKEACSRQDYTGRELVAKYLND